MVTRAELEALPSRRQYAILALACRDALAVWQAYAAGAVGLTYRDGVVGLTHEVDLELPARALDEIDRELAGEVVNPRETTGRYLEPITAMQDDDLGFPGGAGLAYYAIYNLHGIIFGNGRFANEDRVLDQCIAALDAGSSDLLRDWWVRAFDAWATEPPLAYPPNAMTREIFDTLAQLDLEAAAKLAGSSRLGIALGTLLEGRDLAVDFAPDALASYGDLLAVIDDDELMLIDVRDKVVLGRQAFGGYYDHRPRLVRFSREGDHVWVAGDHSDQIGVHGVFCAKFSHRCDRLSSYLHHAGRFVIAALSPNGRIVPAHPGRTMLLDPHESTLLDEQGVVAAVFSDEGDLVTTDGEHISLWRDRELVRRVRTETRPISLTGWFDE